MKKVLSICICLLCTLSVAAQTYWDGTGNTSWTGTGTAEDPILISTAEQLAGLANTVNTGADDFKGKYIELTADIYLSNVALSDDLKHDWIPIGGFEGSGSLGGGDYGWTQAVFRGNFDGKNHTVYHLFHGSTPDPDWTLDNLDDPTLDGLIDWTGWHKALFGKTDSATIQNLRLYEPYVTGAATVSALACDINHTTVRNCHVEKGMLMSMSEEVGGMVGGLVGTTDSCLVENCSSSAKCVSIGNTSGLIAEIYYSTIRDSYATGEIIAKGGRGGAYGFIGHSNYSLIQRCYATGNTTGGAVATGFGGSINYTAVKECYATGNVRAADAAGFIYGNYGDESARIESCYATGNVQGDINYAAAFIYMNGTRRQQNDDSAARVINCFATGKTTQPESAASDASMKDGFGFSAFNTRIIPLTNCYSNIDNIPGMLDSSRGGAFTATTAYMQSQAFVDNLNRMAAICGTSLWQYNSGNYPTPTGEKATLTFFAGGNGTKDNPYQIADKEQLEDFRDVVNQGYTFLGEYLCLTNDIDLNRPKAEWGEYMPTDWKGIGETRYYKSNPDSENRETYQYTFRGDFNGNFHEVRNLYADDIEQYRAGNGLFGNIGYNAHIHNLGVTDAYVNSNEEIGIIGSVYARFYSYEVNYLQAPRITQCWTSGEIMLNNLAGGAVGTIMGGFEVQTSVISEAIYGFYRDLRPVMKNCFSSALVSHAKTALWTADDDFEENIQANNFFYGHTGSNSANVSGVYVQYENCFLNLDSLPETKQGDEEVHLVTTQYMQSRDFVNSLNAYVKKSNQTDTVRLLYWQYNENDYPTYTDVAPSLTVRFESNGGSAVETQYMLSDSHVQIPDKPTQEGKVFAGWFGNEALTKVFDFENTLIHNDTVIYARWLDQIVPDYTKFQNKFATTFTINTKEELLGFLCAVKGIDNVMEANNFAGKTVKLGADIWLNDTSFMAEWGHYTYAIHWEGIGEKDVNSSKIFNGTFLGQGHVIYGLYSVEENGQTPVIQAGGLFNRIGSQAIIQEVGIEHAFIEGTGYVALLAYQNEGTIRRCYAKGTVHVLGAGDGALLAGKITGGRIEDCYTIGYIHAPVQYAGVGGIVSYQDGYYKRDSLINVYTVCPADTYNGNIWAGTYEQDEKYSGRKNNYYQSETEQLTEDHTALTEANMHNRYSFQGFDFDNVWARVESLNNGYPVLRAFHTDDLQNAPDKKTYRVTLIAAKYGYGYDVGTVTGSGIYEEGTEALITATPNNTAVVGGYHFVQWSDGNTDNPRKLIVTQDTTLTATFAENVSYKINAYTRDGSMGTTTGTGYYLKDSIATLTAIPNEGFAFKQWDDGNTDNPRKVKVTQNKTYYAEFYDLSTVQSATVTIDKTTLSKGETAQISVSVFPATAANYSIEYTTRSRYLTVNEAGVVSVSSSPRSERNQQVEVVIRQNGADVYSYTLNITVLPTSTSTSTYTITVEVNDARMGSVSGSGTYDEGTQLSIEATPVEGCHFVRWDDGNTDNPRTITVTEDRTYIAIFEQDKLPTYTITLEANDITMGSVSGSGTYDSGTQLIVMASPAEGCHFVRWSDGNTDNPRTITVTEDRTYTAIFEQDKLPTYTITVETNDITMGSVSGSGTYDSGTQLSIEAVPAEGCYFVRWSDGNTDNPRTITVTEDRTYTAIFEQDKLPAYTITVEANDNTMGSVSGSGTYDEGAQLSIEAVPAEDCYFVRWSDGNTDNPRTITVTEDRTYTAIFDRLYTTYVVSNDNEMGIAGVYADGKLYTGIEAPAGYEVVLYALANEGYRFVRWSDESTDNPHTIITEAREVTYTAWFEKIADALEDIPAEEQGGRKVLINGHFYIVLPDGSIYNANGAKVK